MATAYIFLVSRAEVFGYSCYVSGLNVSDVPLYLPQSQNFYALGWSAVDKLWFEDQSGRSRHVTPRQRFEVYD